MRVYPCTPETDSSLVSQEHGLLLFRPQPFSEYNRIALILVSSFYFMPGFYRAMATLSQQMK